MLLLKNMVHLGQNSLDMPDAVVKLKNQLSSNLNSTDPSFWSNLSAAIGNELKSYQALEAEMYANICWFLKSACDIRDLYIHSISEIKDGDFYKGWCDLDSVENGLFTLLRNPFLDVAEFEVRELLELTHAWQKTFPYKFFLSPEILYKSVQCGICSANITPWERCQHEVGVVYCGACCHRHIIAAELLSLSIVDDPVQKYSVIHTRDDENGQKIEFYNYATVRFVAERVVSPFDGFKVVWIKAFHSHELFCDRPTDGPCPCESGRVYSDCCFPKRGVLRPHLHITFEKEPIGTMSSAELVGYGDKSGDALLLN